MRVNYEPNLTLANQLSHTKEKQIDRRLFLDQQ